MERRGEEVPRRSGASISCLPHSLGLFPPSIVPNLLSFRLSSLLSAAFTSLRVDGWMDGWMEACSDRPTNFGGMDLLPHGIWKAAPPSSICRLLSMPMNTVEFSCRGGTQEHICMYGCTTTITNTYHTTTTSTTTAHLHPRHL